MNTPTQTETLFGGARVGVQLRGGQTLEVFVLQIPIRQMQQYLEAQSNECALIELCCKNTSGSPISAEMVDNLSEESHSGLLAEIERVNGDFFTKWGKRQKERREMLKTIFGLPQ